MGEKMRLLPTCCACLPMFDRRRLRFFQRVGRGCLQPAHGRRRQRRRTALYVHSTHNAAYRTDALWNPNENVGGPRSSPGPCPNSTSTSSAPTLRKLRVPCEELFHVAVAGTGRRRGTGTYASGVAVDRAARGRETRRSTVSQAAQAAALARCATHRWGARAPRAARLLVAGTRRARVRTGVVGT
jgi:hypothetical protein